MVFLKPESHFSKQTMIIFKRKVEEKVVRQSVFLCISISEEDEITVYIFAYVLKESNAKNKETNHYIY